MLIDTSGWFICLDNRDFRHESAVAFYNSAFRRITHNYILAELVALCDARRFSRTRTLAFLSELIDDPTVRIHWASETLTRAAHDLLLTREDKHWSLCDAVSFLIMDENGITEALTTDHHFTQAGYFQLLES